MIFSPGMPWPALIGSRSTAELSDMYASWTYQFMLKIAVEINFKTPGTHWGVMYQATSYHGQKWVPHAQADTKYVIIRRGGDTTAGR